MMDEPDRMFDQPSSSFERALLHEGRSYRGPAELRAHTLAALGLAGSAGLATGGLLAWLAARTWTTKLLLAMSGLTLMVAIPVSYFLLGQDSEPARLAPPRPAAVPPPSPTATPTPPAQVEAPAPVATPAPALAAPIPPPASSARPSAGASSALRAELAALDAVRSTLANDDAAGALSFLDAYFRTFPRGRLHLEAEVLRIDALAKSGRLDAAKRYAQEFLKRNPNSVLTARVQPFSSR
jgi:hypothetical protein